MDVTPRRSVAQDDGYLIIYQHAFGNDFPTKTFNPAVVILTNVFRIMVSEGVVSICLLFSSEAEERCSEAYINIKRLQIDQHRTRIMRMWAYASLNHRESRLT